MRDEAAAVIDSCRETWGFGEEGEGEREWQRTDGQLSINRKNLGIQVYKRVQEELQLIPSLAERRVWRAFPVRLVDLGPRQALGRLCATDGAIGPGVADKRKPNRVEVE